MSRDTMPEYKTPALTKVVFILSILLFIVGIVSGNDTVVGTSVILFIVIGATAEILEKLHSIEHKLTKENPELMGGVNDEQ